MKTSIPNTATASITAVRATGTAAPQKAVRAEFAASPSREEPVPSSPNVG